MLVEESRVGWRVIKKKKKKRDPRRSYGTGFGFGG